ncbi:MAG: cytochrome c biogenesis protein CcdA [Alphaproteobacteria bacterium]|nr:MAG: cytochrome c biogenesis protein CcdA [Alphaproteobacteria bacterium]
MTPTLEISYAAAAGGGIVSFLSPCVLPLVPAYLCLMAGTSLDKLTTTAEGEEAVSSGINWQVVIMAVIFVLGFSTVFVLLGASASYINRLIVGHLDILSKIAGAVIVLFGIHMTGLVRIPLLYREARFNDMGQGRSWFGAYVIGLAFGFGWTPCIGPILGTILALAASDSSLGYGISLLGVYSLGLGIPFILAALALNRFLAFMKGFRRYFHMLEVGTGIVLIATGVLIFTGEFQILSYWFLEAFPGLANLG